MDLECACVAQCERFGQGDWNACEALCGVGNDLEVQVAKACYAGVGVNAQEGNACLSECGLELGSECQTCISDQGGQSEFEEGGACLGDDDCTCVLACLSFPDPFGNPVPTVESCLVTCNVSGNAIVDAMVAFGDPVCVEACGYPDLMWERTHNGSADQDDVARGIVTDASDAIYVVGKVTEFSSAQGTNLWMRMYNADGSTQWTQMYDSPEVGAFDSDEGYDVSFDPDSNEVYFSGTSYISETHWQYFTARDAQSGLEVWVGLSAEPGGTGYATRNSGVAANLQGEGAMLAGDYYNPTDNQEFDALARTVELVGGALAVGSDNFYFASPSMPMDDGFTAVRGVNANNDGIAFVLVGYGTTAATGRDIVISLYDLDLNEISSAEIDSASGDDAALCVDARYDSMSGEVDIVVGGYVEVPGEGWNYWVRRLESSSTLTVWTDTWDNSGSQEHIAGCAFDPAGNVLVGGQNMLRKYDSSPAGVELWTRYLSGQILSVASDSEGNVLVGGERSQDIWVAKFRP